jgi:hypothetical protein
MAKPIPTKIDDVLVLCTKQSFTLHVVGKVLRDGQQDFCKPGEVSYIGDRDEAMVLARSLVARGRRIFIVDIDTHQWSEIPAENRSGG